MKVKMPKKHKGKLDFSEKDLKALNTTKEVFEKIRDILEADTDGLFLNLDGKDEIYEDLVCDVIMCLEAFCDKDAKITIDYCL